MSAVWPTLYNVEYALVLKVKGQENAVTAVFEFSTFIWIKIFFLCVKTAYVHLSSRDCLCMYIYESTFNYTSRSLLSIIATCTLHNNPWMFVLTFHRSFKRTRHWANWPYWFDCMSSAMKYSSEKCTIQVLMSEVLINFVNEPSEIIHQSIVYCTCNCY